MLGVVRAVSRASMLCQGHSHWRAVQGFDLCHVLCLPPWGLSTLHLQILKAACPLILSLMYELSFLPGLGWYYEFRPLH